MIKSKIEKFRIVGINDSFCSLKNSFQMKPFIHSNCCTRLFLIGLVLLIFIEKVITKKKFWYYLNQVQTFLVLHFFIYFLFIFLNIIYFIFYYFMTLFIIIFLGGYISDCWKSRHHRYGGLYVKNEDTFIFSITNPENRAVVFNAIKNEDHIYDSRITSPCFGFVDIRIVDNPNVNKSNTNLGLTFEGLLFYFSIFYLSISFIFI